MSIGRSKTFSGPYQRVAARFRLGGDGWLLIEKEPHGKGSMNYPSGDLLGAINISLEAHEDITDLHDTILHELLHAIFPQLKEADVERGSTELLGALREMGFWNDGNPIPFQTVLDFGAEDWT